MNADERGSEKGEEFSPRRHGEEQNKDLTLISRDRKDGSSISAILAISVILAILAILLIRAHPR